MSNEKKGVTSIEEFKEKIAKMSRACEEADREIAESEANFQRIAGEVLSRVSPDQIYAVTSLAADLQQGTAEQKSLAGSIRRILDPDNPLVKQGIETAKVLGTPALAAALVVGEQVLRSIPKPPSDAELANKRVALGESVMRMFFGGSSDPADA